MENEAEMIQPELEIVEPVERSVDLRRIDTSEMIVPPELINEAQERFYYTIIAPKSFRGNSNYTLNVTIHDAKEPINEPIVVRISIEDEDNDDGFEIHQDVTMTPNVTEVVSIPIGELSLDVNYKLVVKGISGVTLENEASLDLQTQTHTILIQTDKAIYKPNDCIKYRILVLDAELKAAPITQNELIITFTDPCRNIMKKWNGVNTSYGVYTGEFQLSDLPKLGEWKITAAVGDQIKIAVIEVAEYVLPKFEAIIESPDHFTLDDEKVRVLVQAKYTHGKPLRGSVTVSVTEEERFGYHRFRKLSHANKEDEDVILAMKTFNIDGQETVEFDIRKDLKFEPNEKTRWENVRNFKIKADVTEGLTGLVQSTDKTVKVHLDAYNISTDLHTNAPKRDSTLDINISVEKHDGSAITFLDPSKKKIKVIREQFYADVDDSTVTETEHELDDNGDAFFTLDIAKNESSFSLKVVYGKQETDLGMFYTTPVSVADKVSLRAKVLTERCAINKEIEVEVMSHFPYPSYTYLVACRGRILETKTITPVFDDECTEYVHRFKFLPTFDYAPKSKIIVYCVRDGAIVSTSVIADMHDDFKNFIDLNVAPNTAKPGQVVDINVKSNPNSYIGLLGIDKSVLILRSGNDLAQDEIWNELDSFHSEVKRRSYGYEENRQRKMPQYYNQWEEFSRADLITFTNTAEPIQVRCCYKMMACDAMVRSSCFSEPEAVMQPKIRKDFPETWIWESVEDKNFNGLLNLKKKVPDALTTWVLTGFSIDPINGLAITKSPAELCVQQPFHISLNLPYSVKRGEVVTIPCSIFNYLPNQVEAEIIFDNENNDFEFVDAAVDDKIYPELTKQPYRKKKLTILSDDAVNALFTIRPTKVGLISLKVSAISQTASDCIIKTLNVECEGVPQFVNKAVFIDLREKSQIDPINVAIDIPKIALPDSTRIEIICVGDLLGGTIKNLQSLIRLPYGCGEQNMLNFVPNIVVLNYLKNTHQLTVEIETKAKKFMEIGYQREMSYKHKDGSFSAFGQSDKSGSTWLTAFVARSFRQAAEHITIQDDIIDEALKWLCEAQSPNGSFTEKGSICHKEMQAGSSDGVALTAYVLTAFLVNKNSANTYEKTIEKAIENITKSIEKCSDAYALAVCAYALELAGHSSKNTVVARLKELAISKDNLKWWDKSIELKEHCYRESKTLNVEVTAYALLTLMLSDSDAECLPILKWLLTQRNDKGGFEGTQDTIVGLEALAKFAAKIATKDTNAKIAIEASTNTKYNFDVNKENVLVLQSQKLEPDVKSVRINASGKGSALLEVGYRYNIGAPETVTAFSLKTNVQLLNKEHLAIEITTSFQPPKGKANTEPSNMVVLEAALPSGFVFNSELLNGLKTTLPLIKRIETKNADTVAVIYLDHLTTETVSLKIDGFREHIVDEQKPASIVIYDYYDNALSAREFYSLPVEKKMEVDKA